jgi:hypothetical protein
MAMRRGGQSGTLNTTQTKTPMVTAVTGATTAPLMMTRRLLQRLGVGCCLTIRYRAAPAKIATRPGQRAALGPTVMKGPTTEVASTTSTTPTPIR